MSNATPSYKTQSEGRLAQNILYFVRTLRDAGMKVGPSASVDAVSAVELAGITARDDFYWILHCILVKRHEDFAVFDEAFRLFWRSRELVEKMLQMFSPIANPAPDKAPPKPAQSRVSQALFGQKEPKQNVERPEIEVEATFTASQHEILQTKDFAQMSIEELKLARNELAKLTLPFSPVITRRFERAIRPAKIDLRRTLSSAARSGGDLLLPKFKKTKMRQPPIVILADISGSMSQYSRLFLHFFHALADQRRDIHTFLFGTRLSNVTRQLRNKDPDIAISETCDVVEDWSGGTRIAEILAQFNRFWSRRVLGQGAVVLLISDGLEREAQDDNGADLSTQMERLHHSCGRLLWLNPLLRFDGFQAKAKGIRTMLEHVDEFRPVHSLDAISDLCAILGETRRSSNGAYKPGNWL